MGERFGVTRPGLGFADDSLDRSTPPLERRLHDLATLSTYDDRTRDLIAGRIVGPLAVKLLTVSGSLQRVLSTLEEVEIASALSWVGILDFN